MSFITAISSIFTSATAKIVDSVGQAIDRNVTTDHERLQIELKVQEVLAGLQEQVIKANELEQQEITKRLEADMHSDSWLSKNVRPMALVFLTLAVTAIAVWTLSEDYAIDSPMVDVLGIWVDLFTAVMLAVYGFYFGSRGLEKITTALSGRLRYSGKPRENV